MPIERERLSAKKFLKLVQERPSVIKTAKVIPPIPGSPGFGSFEVVYTRPMYRSATKPANK